MKSKPKTKSPKKPVTDYAEALEAALDHVEKLAKENRDLRGEVRELEVRLDACLEREEILANHAEELD